jgi:hypothetical protein
MKPHVAALATIGRRHLSVTLAGRRRSIARPVEPAGEPPLTATMT